MGWVAGVLSARYRANGFLSSAAGMLNSPPRPGLTRRATHWILGGSAGRRSTTVDEFLRAMARDQARRWGIAAIVLLLPAMVVIALEINNFWVAGPMGIVEHRMFPPFSSRRYDLSDARVLTTGCNRTDKNNNLIYDVRLSSGERFDLGNTRPLKGSKIGAIEEIDAKIDPKIEHKRWSHLDRDPVHPACLYHWVGQFDRGTGSDGWPSCCASQPMRRAVFASRALEISTPARDCSHAAGAQRRKIGRSSSEDTSGMMLSVSTSQMVW